MKMICNRCKKNTATITFANSILDWTHGYAEQICKDCYRIQLYKTIQSCKKTLKELDKKEKDGKKRTKDLVNSGRKKRKV